MLPYKINELTNAIQPLKIKEYLATGKPVISTAIKEAEKLVPLICASNSAEEWQEFIQSNIEEPADSNLQERKAFIKNESWQKKSEQFLEYITG
jgi:glycosyltransferase involved in cell wall biosynthesis